MWADVRDYLDTVGSRDRSIRSQWSAGTPAATFAASIPLVRVRVSRVGAGVGVGACSVSAPEGLFFPLDPVSFRITFAVATGRSIWAWVACALRTLGIFMSVDSMA